MIPEVRKASRVIQQLQEIADHIAHDNPQAADDFLAAAQAAFDKLADMPGLGSPWESDVPRFSKIRYWTIRGFENYVILYHPIRTGILVLHVLHGRRDIETILRSTL